MPDGDDLDDDLPLQDGVDDPELASTGREQVRQRFVKSLAHPVGVLRKWPIDELETCCRNSLGQIVSECTFRLARQTYLVTHRRPATRMAASTSDLE